MKNLTSFLDQSLNKSELSDIKGGGTYGSFCEWYFDTIDPNPVSNILHKLMWYDSNYNVTINDNGNGVQITYN